jgi:hypothetical protein
LSICANWTFSSYLFASTVFFLPDGLIICPFFMALI